MKINAEKLKKSREAIGYTKELLALNTNLTRQHIDRLENEKVWITLKTLQIIINELNKSNKKTGLKLPLLEINDFLIVE